MEKLAGEEGTVALVRWDGGDPSRYPEFDAFYEKLRNPPSRPDVRRSVRRALRQRLAATYPVLGLVDPAEDRVLRAAIEELAGKLGIEDYDELLRQEAAVPMTAAAPESEPPQQEAPLEEGAEDNGEQPEDAKASEPDNNAPESEPS